MGLHAPAAHSLRHRMRSARTRVVQRAAHTRYHTAIEPQAMKIGSSGYASVLMDSAAARVEAHYDGLASRYDSSIAVCERMLLEDGRQWAASRAYGNTLEIGIGTGRNLAYFPPDVTLTGVDVSEQMLSRARLRAQA